MADTSLSEMKANSWKATLTSCWGLLTQCAVLETLGRVSVACCLGRLERWNYGGSICATLVLNVAPLSVRQFGRVLVFKGLRLQPAFHARRSRKLSEHEKSEAKTALAATDI